MQITAPAALALVLLGLTGDRNKAVTWWANLRDPACLQSSPLSRSVIGRTLQGTLWPTLLRSDSVATTNVQRRVNLASRLGSLVPILLIAAGILTPLGLSSDGNVAVERSVPFVLSPDNTNFGRSSVPRSEYSFNRACGSTRMIPCPGSVAPVTSSENGTLTYAYANTSIAENVSTIFNSGAGGLETTISTIFDIQYRRYRQDREPRGFVDNGRPRTVGQLRFGQSFLLDNRLQAIDGVIIDTRNGGVGFRNHSVPTGISQATTWTENLLWVEPITSCVDLNLSIEFQLDQRGRDVKEAFLVDEGGLNALSGISTRYDESKPQDNPDLFGRAHYAAVNGNALIAQHLNISLENTHMGARHKLPLEWPGQEPSQDLFGVERVDYVVANPGALYLSRIGSGWIVQLPGLDGESNGVSQQNFTNLGIFPYPGSCMIVGLMLSSERRCGRVGSTDVSGIDLLSIHCHLILTIPERIDGGDDMVEDADSVWRQGGYACATVLRAVVKEVDFSYRPRNDPRQPDLQQLGITAARDKDYREAKDVPLWAVEKSGLRASDVNLFGGSSTRLMPHQKLLTPFVDNIYTFPDIMLAIL